MLRRCSGSRPGRRARGPLPPPDPGAQARSWQEQGGERRVEGGGAWDPVSLRRGPGGSRVAEEAEAAESAEAEKPAA